MTSCTACGAPFAREGQTDWKALGEYHALRAQRYAYVVDTARYMLQRDGALALRDVQRLLGATRLDAEAQRPGSPT